MSWPFAFSALLLLVSSFQRAAAQDDGPKGTCKRTSTCKCKYENGWTIDLTPLKGVGGPRFTDIWDGQYYYDVNLCSDFSQTHCSSATVCQRDLYNEWGFTCGQSQNSYFATEGTRLFLYYIGGEDGRTSRIELTCSTEDGSLVAFGETIELEYDFELKSIYACAQVPQPSALSPGSVLLLIFFVGFIVYFCVGMIVMRFGRHAEGREIVPNVLFWTQLPGLVKDGVLFIWHTIRGGGGGSSGDGGGTGTSSTNTKYDTLCSAPPRLLFLSPLTCASSQRSCDFRNEMSRTIMRCGVGVLLSLLLATGCYGEVCKKEGPCKCRSSKGVMDLSPLQNGTDSEPIFSQISDGKYLYDYSPCADFSNNHCTDVAVCQVAGNTSDSWFNCGKATDTSFGISDADQNIYIDYKGGDPQSNISRSSRVICVCDPSTRALIEAFGDGGTLEYDFTLTSKYCCFVSVPQEGGGGISPGSIMLIVFFNLLFVYLFVGILYMKFGTGAQGKEVMPNGNFWFALPGLIKSGIVFTFRCGKVDTAGSYENIK
ncbi:uncharacterized protein [Oscarella lobularis]|uniref:uncharacterized protein n=1 Tax=Oscarella lobularis TaxID=121494 RepID=UPI003313747A